MAMNPKLVRKVAKANVSATKEMSKSPKKASTGSSVQNKASAGMNKVIDKGLDKKDYIGKKIDKQLDKTPIKLGAAKKSSPMVPSKAQRAAGKPPKKGY